MRLLGQAAAKKLSVTKSGKTMCFLQFEDRSGTLEALIFPAVYPDVRKILDSGEPFLLEGTVSLREDEEPKVLANRLVAVEELSAGPGQFCLYVKLNSADDRRIPAVLELLREYPGEEEVRFYFASDGKYHYPPGRIRVRTGDGLPERLTALLGEQNVAVK